MTKHDIAEIVQRHFDGVHLENDIYFVVDEPGIFTGNDWVRVPIRPSRLPMKLSRLYDVLAEVEEEIAQQESVTVLLLTGEPLEDDQPATIAKAA